MSNTIQRVYGCNADFVGAQSILMGLECEVESVRSFSSELSYGWSMTDDGSLRNNGKEFLSGAKPRVDLLNGFRDLHAKIIPHKFPKFSERTSIHVHVNCQNLTVEQVQNIVLMYALYEEMFFNLCDPSRRHNIHCVPLTETYLPALYKTGLDNMLSRWHKYTALNIKRLTDLGTIEFRHMEGHADEGKLDRWLRALERLVVLCTSEQGKINKDSLSNYNLGVWFYEIFGHTPECSKYAPLLRDITANQRLDLKLSLM